jgi:hypothetical protein
VLPVLQQVPATVRVWDEFVLPGEECSHNMSDMDIDPDIQGSAHPLERLEMLCCAAKEVHTSIAL